MSCGSYNTKKNGKKQGRQIYKCSDCGRYFGASLEPTLSRVDKKIGSVDWREVATHLQARQKLRKKASWSQDEATVIIKDAPNVIVLKGIADQHVGSFGTDYESLVDFTDSLLKIPYLFSFLLGDETDNFVTFKNQLAVLQQILSPEEQDEFVESWLHETMVKMLFATWGNHGSMEEKVSGKNSLKKILNRNVSYFNGIGICYVKLGDQTYKIVATHRTRFNSSMNKTHGLKQLARRDIPDADVYVAGHTHDPSYEVSFERGLEQAFIVLGSFKRNDDHAKQYFSFFSAQHDAAITLDSRRHKLMVWPTLEDALRYAELENREDKEDQSA